jgi:hypothetical protein
VPLPPEGKTANRPMLALVESTDSSQNFASLGVP